MFWLIVWEVLSMNNWHCCFGPVVRQHWWECVVESNYSLHGEEAEERGGDWNSTIPFKNKPSMT